MFITNNQVDGSHYSTPIPLSLVCFRGTTSDGPMASPPRAASRRYTSEKTARRAPEAGAPTPIGKATVRCPPAAARRAAPPRPPRRPVPLLRTLPRSFIALSPSSVIPDSSGAIGDCTRSCAAAVAAAAALQSPAGV